MNKVETREYVFDLPQADTPLGRWFEANGANIDVSYVSCTLGKWRAIVTRRKLHSYSDDKGSHAESWVIDRESDSMTGAMVLALKAAGAPL